MYQVDMSHALAVVAAIGLLTLGGCATPPPMPLEVPAEVPTCTCTNLQKWLQLQRKVSVMTAEKVAKKLTVLGEPNGQRELYYFGLLNQQLDAFTGWTQARDTFRQLAGDVDLDEEKRDLAVILQRYNQTRINWYLQHRQLLENNETMKAKLRESNEENELLEQKLQAITDLETSISTRKE